MPDTPSDDFASVLKAIARAHMPFGKYGPTSFPPRGIPLYDLPYEYLAWFARKGFPDGRLGEMLRFLYLAKRDGADAMFDPIRKAVGGRTNLRPPRRRRYDFRADRSTEDDGERPS